MLRHLVEITDVTRDDVDQLFSMARQGPVAGALKGRTHLSAFFQESTRSRLGFMSAAARQGATLLDIGPAEQLRREPRRDQQLVLSRLADIVTVRHWDAAFARAFADLGQCSVVNAGAGGASHPSQALVDAFTLVTAFGRELDGLHVVFLGPLLRSALSFVGLAAILGLHVSQHDLASSDQAACVDLLRAADVVYIQSLSDVDYEGAELNAGGDGPALPDWAMEAIQACDASVMHALPRGAELPDSLMWSERSLVTRQLECGLAVRSAILRWLVEPL